MREKVLLSGETNTSKTLSLINLAVLYPDRKVVILDPDDGTAKAIGEIGFEDCAVLTLDTLAQLELTRESLPNLTIVPIRSDWGLLISGYRKIRDVLLPGDWFCMDMMGRFWEKAQEYYSTSVFGKEPIEHIMTLKRLAKEAGFGGFDGLSDWPLIKKLHNQQLVDDAVVYSTFNVMCTTSTTMFSPKEKVPKTGTLGIYASEFGVKPEGEKHNIYRFDTQAMLYRKKDNTYWFRLVRDRGRPLDIHQEFDITGKSFMEVYAELRGL